MKIAAIEPSQFARFLLAGITAVVANLASVWLCRAYLAYEHALLVGIAAALLTSFLLSKLFAFESRSWRAAPGEAVRFLVVYAAGCVIYWWIAVSARRLGQAHGLAGPVAEGLGIIVGGGVMAVATYLGHRFFTYRSDGPQAEGARP
ncbi:MAG TPA: GtrA family protein [Acetobacteraceae bacterium]|nr:GtrA family protein [Acetobacteraceae bacterium]